MQNKKYIKRCLQLAKLGLGKTKANPMVGAVLVYKNRIIGEGFHKKFGEAHAEVECLNAVKKEDEKFISESTLYVNLEPCSHFGKTPPCVDLVLKNRIKKVVIASVDDAKHVNGKGIEKLKDAGVEVEVGILDKENKWLNRRFFTYQNKKRPYVILKFAQTKNGFFAPKTNEQKWITNNLCKKIVHKWRSEEQAILVGTNTFKIDKPKLNNRLWIGNSPIIVLIDKDAKLDATHLSKESKVLIFNSLKDEIACNTSYLKIDFGNEILKQILDVLYKLKIASLFVEGGLFTLQQFIKYNFWDEARILTGNVEWQNGKKSPSFENYEIVEQNNLLDDKLTIIKNQNAN